MKSYIWRVLLSESQELIDDLVRRGTPPVAEEVVERVLSTHRLTAEVSPYRWAFFDEVQAYLDSSIEASF